MKLAIIDFSQEDDVCSRKLVGSFIDGLYEIGSDYNVFKIEELNIFLIIVPVFYRPVLSIYYPEKTSTVPLFVIFILINIIFS